MTIRLFHCPGVCSLASLIALEETGAAFETVIVDLHAGEQHGSEYRAINPKGRVPALAVDGDSLTENPAIMAYVAMRFPEADIAPLDDSLAFARMQSFNAFLASSVQPALGPLGRPERYTDESSAFDGLKTKAIANVTGYFELLEDELFVGPWVLGSRYSLADGYLFTFSELIQRLGMDDTRFPKIIAHRKRMMDRPAVVRAVGAA